MVGLLDETFKENLQVPSGCHFAAKGGSLSLLMSTLTVEFHQPEPQREAERMLDILQTLLQSEPHFTASATEQTIGVPKTKGKMRCKGVIFPLCWIGGGQHAGLQIRTSTTLCAFVVRI